MSEAIAKPRLSDFLQTEMQSMQSRKEVILLAGSGSDRILDVGTVMGMRTKGALSNAADGGNTGDGVVSADSLGPKAKVGDYVAVCIAASANAGTFELSDPDGNVIGRATVAVAFAHSQINFTIGDGATDWAVGDKITFTVAAGDNKLVSLAPPVSATGSLQLDAVPTATKVIVVNGKSLAFVAATPGTDEILIGDDVSDSMDNIVAALNAHVDTGIDDATYSRDDYNKIIITHDTPGTGGNAFTLTTDDTNIVRSGATLAGGAATAVDGSQDFYGILGDNVTVPDGTDKKSWAILRNAVVGKSGLIWTTGVLQAQKDAALADMEKQGVLARTQV